MPTAPDDPELVAWFAAQPRDVVGDPLWRLDAYRHAAFLLTLARTDAALIRGDPAMASIAAQLLTAAGSVAANIAEGYGRPTAADRIRFFAYALGSLRETHVWYETASVALTEDVRADRLARMIRLRRILYGLLTRLRARARKPADAW